MKKRGVYLISDGNGCVKIGVFSKDPQIRLKQLQTAHSRQLKVISYIFAKDAYDHEKRLHEKYRHLHVSGEWFMWSDEIKLIPYLMGEADQKMWACPVCNCNCEINNVVGAFVAPSIRKGEHDGEVMIALFRGECEHWFEVLYEKPGNVELAFSREEVYKKAGLCA